MGGFPTKAKRMERERLEAERKAMIRYRLAIFNDPESLKPKVEDDSDSEDWNAVEKRENEAALLKKKKNDSKSTRQLELTENNLRVQARKLSADNAALLAKNLDGPSSILDGKMMKVLEFMLDPDFNKGALTLRTLLTTPERKSSLLFSQAVLGIAGILVLVKSVKGHVFGAYIADKYEGSNGGWRKGSDENFIFAMGNITQKPIKLLADPERRYSYFSDSTAGFYAGQGEFDLSAFSARYVCMKPVVFTVVSQGFTAPEGGLDAGVLCGTPGQAHYEPALMEVFAVTHFEDPEDPATKARAQEREKIAAQKAIEKEKRAKQRRAERKMKQEQNRRLMLRREQSKVTGTGGVDKDGSNIEQGHKSVVLSSTPQASGS